jgi:hypothetical protein
MGLNSRGYDMPEPPQVKLIQRVQLDYEYSAADRWEFYVKSACASTLS